MEDENEKPTRVVKRVTIHPPKLLSSSKLEEVRQGQDVCEVYDQKVIRYARHLLMKDLIKESCMDAGVIPGESKAKASIIKEFQVITGCTQPTAWDYYNKNVDQAAKLIDLGAVAANAIARNYSILDKYQKIHDDKTAKLNDKIRALDGMTNVIKNMADFVARTEGTSVNRDKNEVLREKIKADTAVGAGMIAARLEGTKDDKVNQLTEMFKSQKALKPVMNELKRMSQKSDDEDLPEADAFKGEVVDE